MRGSAGAAKLRFSVGHANSIMFLLTTIITASVIKKQEQKPGLVPNLFTDECVAVVGAGEIVEPFIVAGDHGWIIGER